MSGGSPFDCAQGKPFDCAQGRRRRATGLPALLALLGLLVGAGPVAAQVEVVEYYATDAVGSVRVVFNASGQVVARADYQPFGELFAPVGELPPQQFTGQARDGEAGLDYFGARFYQPRHGRFTQVDPVYAGLFDPQQWNRYAYARANPLSFVDPDGRCVGTPVWNGRDSWVLSCGTADTDRRGPGGGGGGGMSTAAWGLGGLAWGGWGGGFGYTDPGRGAGGGRSGGGPGSTPQTPQDGTGATTPDPETAVACSGAECGPLVPNPLTDVLGQAAPVSQALGVGAVVGVVGRILGPGLLASIRTPFIAAGIKADLLRADKWHHIFSRAEHGLARLGHPLDVLDSLSRSLAHAHALRQLGDGGRFVHHVYMHGNVVVVRGVVHQDRVRVGTAYVERLRSGGR